MSCLQRFPVDTLEIDPSFICDIENDANANPIIGMARGLQLRAQAARSESKGNAARLTSRSCVLAQGFYRSESLAAVAFCMLLQQAGANPV